ncbi:MAG: alpha/beta hydrolase [Actinomycetota bacterium]|nr:alpha/beta hydrolase [Actinomycetota bacterium]
MSYARNGGNRIWWDEMGSGEPLLLAMGHGWDSRMWWRAMPALAVGHRVIRFDNRGIGRTEWDGQPFGIEDLAADAFTVLDAAGVTSAHVYGMSMGGLTVQEMALSQPARVRSLVLGCTRADSAIGRTQPKGEGVKAKIPFWLLAKLFRGALYGPHPDPDAVAQDLRLMRTAHCPSDGRLAQSRAIASYASLERIHEITAPTLILHGDKDRAVPVAKGQELAAHIPGAELVVLPGAGHAYLAEVGTRSVDAVLDFLTRHRADQVA